MKYDLKISHYRAEAIEYLNKLLSQNAKIEIKKVAQKKTVTQNAYFYVICGYISEWSGLTIKEVKDLLRRKRKDLFTYSKTVNGKEVKFYKEYRELNKEEVAKLIDWTLHYFSKEHGLRFATPEEYRKNQFQIDSEIENNKFN